MAVKLNQLRNEATLEAAGFIGAAKQAAAAARDLAAGTNEVTAAMSRSETTLSKRQSGLERLKRTIDPTYDSTKKLEAATRLINAEFAKNGDIAERDRLLEAVRQKYLGTALAQQAAAKAAGEAAAANLRLAAAYDRQMSAFEKMRDMQNRVNSATGVSGGADSASRAADIAAYGNELDRLRSKFVPLFSAQQQYLAQLNEIRTAQKVGALTQAEAAAAIERTKTAFASQVVSLRGHTEQVKTTTAAVEHGTSAIRLQAYQIANLGQQIQDVGISLAGGQNPFLAIAQQAPQAAFAVGGFSNLYRLAMQAITSPTGMAVIGIGSLAAGMALIGARAIDLASESRAFGVALRGMGRDAEVSTAQLNRLVEAMRDQGVSKADARATVTTALRNPGLTATGAQRVSSLAADFGAGTGQDVQAAAKALTEGLTGGFDSAMKLANAYRLLSPAQKDVIRGLYETGQAGEGAKLVMDALEKRFSGLARDSLGPAGEAFLRLGRAWNGFLDTVAASRPVLAMLDGLAYVMERIAAGADAIHGSGAQAPIAGQVNQAGRQLIEKQDYLAYLQERRGTMQAAVLPDFDLMIKAAEMEVARLQARVNDLTNQARQEAGPLPDIAAGGTGGSGLIQSNNFDALRTQSQQIAARQRLAGASPYARAIGEADIKTAQMALEKNYGTEELATLAANNRKEAVLGLNDALAKASATAALEAAGALKVAAAYQTSTAAGEMAAAQSQAAVESYTSGANRETRAREILIGKINEQLTAASAQIEANREEVINAERLADAQKRGVAAYAETELAIKQETATREISVKIQNAEALGNETLAEALRKVRDERKEQIAVIDQQNKASALTADLRKAEQDIEIAGLQATAAKLTDVNERRAAEIALARQMQAIQLKNDPRYAGNQAAQDQLLTAGDKVRALQDNARFYSEVRGQAEDLSRDVSQFLVDGFVNANKGGKSAFQNLWEGALAGAKRFAAQIAATFLQQQILMPIAMQVVGGSPGTFGVANPGGGASSGSGFSMPSLGGGGFGSSITNSINDWGARNLGTAANAATSVPSAVGGWTVTGTGGPSASSLSQGTTLTQYAGAGLGVASGIYQLATAKSAGGAIGGVSSIASGLMLLNPATAPFAPLVAIGGNLLGGLFGGKKPSVGPGGGIGFGLGADGTANIGWTVQDNGYDPVAKNRDAANQVGTAALAFFKQIGGTYKGTGVSDRGAELGYDAGLKKYVGGDDTSGGKGRYDTLEQAMAASLVAVVKNSIVDGVSKDIQARIKAVNTSQDMENLLQYIADLNQIYDSFKGWAPPITAAEQAMQQLNAAFDQAKSAAESLSKSTDDLKASFEKQKAYLISEFNAPLIERELRAKGKNLDADLLAFDRQAAETRKGAAALGGAAVVQAEKTLVAERLRIQLGYMEQSKQAEESRLAPLRQTYDSLISELQNMRNVWKGIAEQMLKFRDSLKIGALSTLSPEQQMREAQRQYASTLARARAGDVTAAGELEGYAQTALTQTQSYYASGAGYATFFDQVQGDLTDFADYAGKQVSLADQALGVQKDTLANVRTIAQIMSEMDAAKKALTNAGGSIGGVAASAGSGLDGGGFGNGSLSTDQNISNAYKQFWGRDAADWEVKAWTDLISSGKASASGAFASIQYAPQASEFQAQNMPPTPPRTLTDIAVDLSKTKVSDVIKMLPGFASGGVTMPGEMVRVHPGEMLYTGPETRVFNPMETARLFAGGNDNSAAAEIRALRAEVAGLKAAMVQATMAGAGGVIQAVRTGSEAEAKMASTQARQAAAPASNAA